MHDRGYAAVRPFRKADVTTAYTQAQGLFFDAGGVYVPQDDSRLLMDVMGRTGLARGRRVVDLCTGGGAVAIEAAEQGASAVTAVDICRRAVRCARANALTAGVEVDVHMGSWARAVEFGPFDLAVCNPPYVPHDPNIDAHSAPPIGPARAWNGGYDGRLVLDPLCEAAPGLIADGGTLLLVQSEFAVPRRTLAALASVGLDAEIVASRWIPFGPVLSSRAEWLEDSGLLEPGRREEELVVVRADKA